MDMAVARDNRCITDNAYVNILKVCPNEQSKLQQGSWLQVIVYQ